MSQYFLTEYSDAASLFRVAEEFLLQHEAEHNLILGLLAGIISGAVTTDHPWFFEIKEDLEVVGYGIRTHASKGLVLSNLPMEASQFLATAVFEKDLRPREVTGPRMAASAFARTWQSEANVSFSVLMEQGVYRADKIDVAFCAKENGSLMVATAADLEVAGQFCLAFLKDCFPFREDHATEAERLCKTHVDRGTLHFWKNSQGEVVSMAASIRGSKNAGCLSLVYTPPQWRGKGYASAVTAALSAKIMKDGKKFCTLFTDLANPTSNSIYQKIGYQKIGESLQVSLDPSNGS